MRFEAPMALVGLMALSVEMRMKRSTWYSVAICTSNRGKGVVLDGFPRLRFHHGDMLVSRRVEYDFRSEFLENGAHARLIEHVRHEGTNAIGRIGLEQFLLDLEKARL